MDHAMQRLTLPWSLHTLLLLRSWNLDSSRLLKARPLSFLLDASSHGILSGGMETAGIALYGFSNRKPLSGAVQSAGPFRHSHTSKNPPKLHTSYVCDICGSSFPRRFLTCPDCGEENTLKMFKESALSSARGGGGGGALELTEGRSWLDSSTAPSSVSPGPRRLTDILKGNSQCYARIHIPGDLGIEVSRVLGGGLVPGSLILVGGDPGVGKSTLLLQVAGLLSGGKDCPPVLYASGEESVEQISSRADRIELSSPNLFIYPSADLEALWSAIVELSPYAVIIDSIQSLYLESVTGSAGSINQVKECAFTLLRLAKMHHISIFLIGHVTKSGEIAGPQLLEHIVDVVLYMEGESSMSSRLLRVEKNRFGSTNEIGVFEMVEGGLVAVSNPSGFFLSKRSDDSNNVASAAIAAIMEGSRPFLIEIQALFSVQGQHGGRLANGVDSGRLFLILVVLKKFFKLRSKGALSILTSQSLFINVVGGMKIQEPAADLAIAVAILSSCLDRVIPMDMVFVGEIGLSGELRSVKSLEKRIIECMKLGFRKCVVPKSGVKAVKDFAGDGIEIIPCSSIKDIVDGLLLPTTALVNKIDCS